MIPQEPLVRALNYQFNDSELLKTALTHRSAASRHNERLEFLGDSILNFAIALALFDRFPRATEGELSRLRAALVKEETLAEVARFLKLGDFLFLGSGELKSGGFRRNSILADALEAIIGAVLIDSDFESCRQLILHLYKTRIERVCLSQDLKDPKSRLQEFLQSRGQPLPVYHVVLVDGEAHDQVFKVTCEVEGVEQMFRGEGRSRRRAEQSAAEHALGVLAGESNNE